MIGLVLFLAAIGWLVAAGRRRPGPQLALALALPAYFLHGLLDFDWDFVSVSAPVFLIAGALAVAPHRAAAARGPSRSLRRAVCAPARSSCSLFAVWLGNRWDGQAASAVGVDNGRAITLARRARSIDPFLVDPLFQSALAESAIAAARQDADRDGRRPTAKVLGLLREGDAGAAVRRARLVRARLTFDYVVRSAARRRRTRRSTGSRPSIRQDPKTSLYPQLAEARELGHGAC